MKQVSTLFLRIAVIFIGLPVLAMCIFLVPGIGNVAGQLLPEFASVKYFVFFLFYGSALPFYFALYQALKLLSYIDKGKAFSQISVEALKKIKYCAISISSFHVLLLPLFYLFAEMDDAPGVIFVGVVVPFASMIIAVFAAVLQRLLQEAIQIKSENDLTV
ncbi:DUF2975 domain-containing protein [Sporosarcina pasteurii]|uniref:Protein of uncharacterized function (DUF3036) n=1 Tax=Sporosarcina pasteurii TaxID=1474 RepID=A0A380CFG7_SPOPA|nr:DUF2975 domain-containing protein [Sporosarcina pasteurii]MDS9473218.1 DUF2975 domain-containing protein [Sporosarcina pasteurii]QBQ06951.1 DUF2975 domain-containing protein [Sporosarcina pasteurii]SUJ18239.1 Protein of uncharacterised function (DUF3036) [Sporosarcina pasteurii]